MSATTAPTGTSVFRSIARTPIAQRGFYISHMLGASLVLLLLGSTRLDMIDIPIVKATWLPIFLLALHLLLDRSGRRSRVDLTYWDLLNIGFLVFFGLAMVAADLAYGFRGMGVMGYLTFLLTTGFAYILYLVFRESALRVGFDWRTVVKWLFVGGIVAAVAAVLQFIDFPGVRQMLASINRWDLDAQRFTNVVLTPNMSRGFMPHPNTMAAVAAMLLASVPLVASFPKWKHVAYGSAPLFLACTLATTSRTGLLTAFAVLLSWAVHYMITRQYTKSMAVFGGVAIVAVTAAVAIQVFDIERLKVIFERPEIVARTQEQTLTVWSRVDRINLALERGSRYPLTGLAPMGVMGQDTGRVTHSPFFYENITMNAPADAFQRFGVVGLLFIGGQIVIGMICALSRRLSLPARATALGYTAALFTNSLGENPGFSVWVVVFLAAFLAFVGNDVIALKLRYPARPRVARDRVGPVAPR